MAHMACTLVYFRYMKSFLFAFGLTMISCHLDYQSLEFRRGEKDLKDKKFLEALIHYEKVMNAKEGEFSVKAARKAAWLSYFHLKKFRKALGFYKYLVVHSDSEKEKVSSQEKIISIYFDKLADYRSSLSEINRLLEIGHTNEKKIEYGLKLAKSYFYLGDFRQARVEVDSILVRPLSDRHKFEAMSLKGNVHLTAKELREAVVIYKGLQKDFPKQANNEKVGLSVAVCYEEMGELDLAIEELKKVQAIGPRSELIDMKIKRLEARKSYLPGAKGLQK